MKSKRNLVLLGVVFLLLLLDLWTKHVVHTRFFLGESIPVLDGFFNLTYVRNTGAAFGMLATAHPGFRIPFFLFIPLVALGVILYTFKKLPKNEWWVSTALTLILSGAIGNLIDRIRFGFVIDFLDFHWRNESHFPAFNVADSAICVGVGMMMIDAFRKRPAPKKESA